MSRPHDAREGRGGSRTSAPITSAAKVRWLGSRGATRRELRAALRFWVDRADRFEDELPADAAYLKARGVLSNHYTLGKAVRDADA